MAPAKQALPGAPDIDEVVAVGAVAVQAHDELAGGAKGLVEVLGTPVGVAIREDSHTVKLGH